MRSAILALPGSLATLTGGTIYDRRIVHGLRDRGWALDVVELDTSFPEPTAAALAAAGRAFAAIPDGTTVIVDGLAFGAMPDVVEAHMRRLSLVALIHMPLALDVGITAAAAARREAAERRALAGAALVVVTGPGTRDTIAAYGVGADRIALVEPGTDAEPLARGSRTEALQLLCVGAIVPGKGHAILLRALARLRGTPWRLTCVGSLSRDRGTALAVRELARQERLDERVDWVGELDGDRLEARYATADLFVLATLRETWGMAVAEAIAHGLPVVSTRTGAIPDLLADGAGLVVEPGSVDELTVALSRAMLDGAARVALRDGARRTRERLDGWDVTVGRMATALEGCVTR